MWLACFGEVLARFSEAVVVRLVGEKRLEGSVDWKGRCRDKEKMYVLPSTAPPFIG